jgi:hypothetical protein
VIKDDCQVVGVPGLLSSAIENVVRNAARYTPGGTSAEISLERGQSVVGAEAVIRVIDSGSGVPEEALDKIFRPFYRIDDARGRQTGGAGLGLAITERAVRLHGGSVKASNRPEGGLKIEIRLPLAPSAVPDGPVVAEAKSELNPAADRSGGYEFRPFKVSKPADNFLLLQWFQPLSAVCSSRIFLIHK